MADSIQQQLDQELEDSIKNDIKGDLDSKELSKEDPPEPKESPKEPEEKSDNVKNRKKSVDKNKNNTDTDTDDQPDEAEVFDQVVQKVLQDEYDGDESRLSEAKAVANVAVKTFNGDPVKAAKSYRNLYRQHSEFKNTLKSSPFIEKLIQDAKDGKTVDENYVKSLVGTATSDADQPKTPKESLSDQLEDDDFDIDSITTDQLFESGILDKDRYENADAIDRKDMVEKARIRYSYKVLPEKMAERTVKLSQKKEQQKRQEAEKQKAIATNKQRVADNMQKVVTEYDVDFEGNPEHAQLWDEVKKTIYRVPDLTDDSGRLVSENAVEQAVQHVFSKHNVPLNRVNIINTDDNKPDEHKMDRMASGSMSAMARILGDAQGFKGKNNNSQRSKDDAPDNSLDGAVSRKVEQNLNRGWNTANIISGQRKTDRKKPN